MKIEEKSLRVLIVGTGGREHALLKACKASPLVAAVSVVGGNGGMEQEAVCYPINLSDTHGIVSLAKERLDANFVIVGPEAPLSLGLVDALEQVKIPAYGPKKAGALLEASKNYTKEFLLKYNIPTAKGRRFVSSEEAEDYLENQEMPIVIKADGLAAGKGVIIAETKNEARDAVREILDERCFGDSGAEILIEEFMAGEEASIMLMVSGEKYVMLPASQDHKRIGENDTGLNTGGMGAYAPAAVVTPEIEKRVVEEIIEPTLKGLKKEGIDYRGTLYIGIMITNLGPKVVEFNVRFGDPECQVLLPLLATDPIKLMYDCATDQLDPTEVKFNDGYNVVVVLAAEGYPGHVKKGDTISFPISFPKDVSIIHSGTTRERDGRITTSGGRVLGIVAHADTLANAAEKVYNAIPKIHFNGMYFRNDIGHHQLDRE